MKKERKIEQFKAMTLKSTGAACIKGGKDTTTTTYHQGAMNAIRNIRA